MTKSKYFSDKTLNLQIKQIVDFYADRGFPFAVVQAQDFIMNQTGQTVNYNINIIENEKVNINDITFTKTTVPHQRLKQILGFSKTEKYSRKRIAQKLHRLAELQITYQNYEIVQIDTSYILQVCLNPLKSSQLTGALTYLPAEQNLNGYFYFNNHNLFNSLRRLNFTFEKFSPYSTFAIKYQDPYLFGLIFNTSINHTTYDTIYSQTDVDLQIAIPLNNLFSTSFKTNYNRLAVGIANLKSNTTWWFSQGLHFLTADLNQNIPRTYSLTIIPQIGSRRIEAKNTYLSYLDLGAHTDLPVKNRLGYMLDITAKYIYCKDGLTMADSLRLGGIKNLRGFEENQFATNQYLLIKNELRYYISSTTLLCFNDLGLIKQTNKKPVKNGFGIGLRIKSKIGIVGIDYGLSQITNPLQGKIHLTFQNQF